MAGQIAGGVLVDLDIAGTGWRPVFPVNVPIGVLPLVAGLRWLPQLAQVVGVATFGTLMLELADGFVPAASGDAFAVTAVAMATLMLAGGALIGVRVQVRAVSTSPPIEG